MFVIGETLLVQTIQGAFGYFRTNAATLVPDIFGNLPTSEQQEWQTWLQNPANQIFVFEGYPIQAQQLPCVAVVLGIDAEVGAEQTIGELWGPWQPTDATGAVIAAQQGMSFQTTYSCLVLAVNQNQAKWISHLTRWALLANRQYLEAQGLYSQSMRAQEFAPDTVTLQQEDIFAYRRVITLTASHVDTFTVSYPSPSTVEVDVTEQTNVVDITSINISAR